jgi:MFS family permease
VAFAVRLPWLLFALGAGVLADRLDRRQMMIWANLARVAVLGGLVITALLNVVTLPLIYLAALLLGFAETLADTAGSTVLPSVVKTKDLEKANAHLVGVTTVTNEFIGPPLGGALAALSLALAFATSSALYLAAAVSILLMTGSFRPTSTAKAPMLSDLLDGLRFVWNDRLLRALVIIVAVMNVGWSAWASIMVLYVVAPGPGGLSEVGYGVMLTSIGIGGLAGTLLAVPLVKRFGRRWAIGADIIGTFVMLAIPALTANAWAIGAAAVIGGIGGAMWGIVVSSIRQQVVPNDMLGRTSGVFRLFGYGALPIGAALAGFVAETFGIPMVFALCAALTLLLFVPFSRSITTSALTVNFQE